MHHLPILRLKPGKEQSVKRYHPWVFSGAVKGLENSGLKHGELVAVHDSNDNFLALGHYHSGSIAVRIVSYSKEIPDDKFWANKIARAWQLRIAIGLADSADTTAFRLVHGESDGLPGLIIDIYNSTAVLQAHTLAMYNLRPVIVKALQEVMGDRLKAVFDKSERTLTASSGIEARNSYLLGSSGDAIVKENGLRFNVGWEKGQKTGFFVDNRDNRHLLEAYSKGRKLLNLYCYTGAFSCYALRGGATLVHSVDSSERAVMLCNENVELNFPGDGRHKSFVSDSYKYMEAAKEKYDLIILDPPAFAKHHAVINNAIQGYKRINVKAMEMIAPGGILFTYSCSQLVSREAFRTMLFSAAASCGRNIRILHQMSQAADHPISMYHPESEYLKGFVLYVE